MLLSPEVDLAMASGSIVANAAKDVLPAEIPVLGYLGDDDPSDPRVSVVYADLRRFPRTFVAYGSNEMFRDQIERFAMRLPRRRRRRHRLLRAERVPRVRDPHAVGAGLEGDVRRHRPLRRSRAPVVRRGALDQPRTLPKSCVRQCSGVSVTVTDAAVLGLCSAYHAPSCGPR